jgi:outer membrane protein TolC
MLTVLNAERTLLSVQDQLAGSDSPPATALVAVQRAHGRRGEMTPDMADSKAL